MSIHHQSKSHFKTLTKGKNKFSRHLEQLASSEERVLGVSYDIFYGGRSEHNTTLGNVLFYAPTKVNSPKTWKYFGIYPEKHKMNLYQNVEVFR